MLGAQQLDAEELGLAGLVRRMLRGPVLAADRAAMPLRAVPTRRERLGQHHGRARNLGAQARERAHERTQVEVQRERRAGAGARNAHDGRAVDDREAGMVPRAVVRLMADHLPHLLHDLARPVVASLRGPGVEHHDVGLLNGLRNGLLDGIAAVGDDIERNEAPAPLLAFRLHKHAVRLEVAPAGGEGRSALGVEGHAGSHQLVARGDERHAGAAHHRHRPVVARTHASRQIGRDQLAGAAQHVAATHGAAHRARASAGLRRHRVDDHVLLICGNLRMLDDDGRVEPFRHGNAGVGELPIPAAHPRAGVGHFAICQVGKIGPVQRDGIHSARERAGHIVHGAYIVRQHAPHRFRQGNALHQLAFHLARMVGGRLRATPAEALRLRVQRRQRCRHRILARQLYMLRMVPHGHLFP